MEYVVLRPKIIMYAFGGCYSVIKKTDKFIFYKKTSSNGEDSWEERISKKNVMFFTDKNIAEELTEWNKTCWREHKEFEDRIKALQANIKKQYE